MSKSMKQVQNPLGIVALFVSLMEAMATVSLKFTLDASSDYVGHLVWFIVLFPVVIFLMFFGILWIKREIFYSPADFREDASFLRLLGMVETLEIKQRAKDVDPRMRGAEDTALRAIAELSQIGELGTAFHLALAFVKVGRREEAKILFRELRALSPVKRYEALVRSAGDQYSEFFGQLNSGVEAKAELRDRG